MNIESKDPGEVECDVTEQDQVKAKNRLPPIPAKVIALTAFGLTAAIIGVAYYFSSRPDVSFKRTSEPKITAEQARASLLKVEKMPRFRDGENDPILSDLRNGAIVQTDDSVVKLGRFFSFDLKNKTGKISYNFRAATAKMSFACAAQGHFEYHSDGTWKAFMTNGYIT